MTLGEMKARMGSAELHTWAAYIDSVGPLSLPLRIDAAIARAVTPFLKNAKPADFMPWPKEPEEEATPEKVFHLFRGLTRRKK